MAGDRVNNYSQVDSNILELQLTADKTFKGYHQLTLTEYDTTTVPAIAAGSAIECNGALYKFDTEEAISTTDPVTSATVADGTVYVCIIPDTTTATAAFTATAPTWSDSKQGWYGTGGQANYRYAEYLMVKASTSYSYKNNLICYQNKIHDTVIASTPGTQTIANTNEVAVIINSKTVDHLNSFNTSTYKFTPAYTGIYLINSNILATSGSGTLQHIRFQDSVNVILDFAAVVASTLVRTNYIPVLLDSSEEYQIFIKYSAISSTVTLGGGVNITFLMSL